MVFTAVRNSNLGTNRVSLYFTCGSLITALTLRLVSEGLVGKVDFTVRKLTSNTAGFTTDFSSLTATNPCLAWSGQKPQVPMPVPVIGLVHLKHSLLRPPLVFK